MSATGDRGIQVDGAGEIEEEAYCGDVLAVL